jgi:YbbR domain-containing protein
VTLEALDVSGRVVAGVTITPREVGVVAPINLLGGYKNAAVKVITKGQVSPGYRLTNILVSPPTVTLFSNNPQLIEQIPGFVETQPIDLTNLVDDIELTVDLNLPDGVTLVRDRKVVVQVSVAALEGSLTLAVPVEAVGLAPGLQSDTSPGTIDVIVSGPLNILDRLTPASLRVVLDLSGLEPGVYQRQVSIDQSPSDVVVESTLPEVVEVTISIAPPTPTGGPTPSPTPAPTARPQ